MNKKLALVLILTTLMVVGFASAGEGQFGIAQTGTQVSGIINSDTAWTKANGPYTLTGPTAVAQNVTLIIEPGVTVNLNNYFILVNGTLRAIGVNADPIYIGGTIMAPPYGITFTGFNTPWNEQTGLGSIIENAIISSTVSAANTVKINNNTLTGVVYGAGSSIITNNISLVKFVLATQL